MHKDALFPWRYLQRRAVHVADAHSLVLQHLVQRDKLVRVLIINALQELPEVNAELLSQRFFAIGRHLGDLSTSFEKVRQ